MKITLKEKVREVMDAGESDWRRVRDTIQASWPRNRRRPDSQVIQRYCRENLRQEKIEKTLEEMEDEE